MTDTKTKEALVVKPYKGGCACGAVRYEARSEPFTSVHCCCRQCQRATGAGHASQLAMPLAAVSFVGELKFFYTTADSGNTVSSGFCPACGSPILKKSSGYPEMIFLHAATMDEPSRFRAREVVWSASRQPWDHIDTALI